MEGETKKEINWENGKGWKEIEKREQKQKGERSK